MAPLPAAITFEAMDRYAHRHAFTGPRYERFCWLVGALDDAYLEHAAEEARRRSARKGK